MSSPAPTRRRLAKPPLVLMLCEVRFAPVLAMERLVADVQDSVRTSGYPGMEMSTLRQLQIDAAGPRLTELPRWVFSNEDRTSFITLATASVSLLTTSYDGFDEFIERMQLPIEIVQQVVRPAYAERVGLRYVDVVKNVGQDARKYFKEAVLSFSAEQLGVESLLSAQQVVARTKVGQLTIRMTQVENAPLLPPDLLLPELTATTTPEPGIHAILDIDSSAEGRVPFSKDDLSAKMWSAHEYNDSAFWNSITPEAEKEWGIE